MNIKNILEIARALIDGRAKFDMASGCFDTGCGSAGCIAGHIAYLYPRKTAGITRFNGDGVADEKAIRVHFEIPQADAFHLFLGGQISVGRISRWDAAAALVRYARNKEIDFKRTEMAEAIAMVEAAERKFLVR